MSEEEVIGVISGIHKRIKGPIVRKNYHLLITNKRIIGIAGSLTGILAGSLFGYAGMKVAEKAAAEKGMDFDKLEKQKDIIIEKGNINAIHLKAPGFFSGGQLTIEFSTGKIDFINVGKEHFKQIQESMNRFKPEVIVPK